MIVVADASVLISLSTIQRLPLLAERFPQGIVLPQAVWREVVEQGGTRPGAREVASADWITVRTVSSSGIVRLLLMELEVGEAEAIALAHELGAQVVLLDERDARHAAERLGISTLGTIGILVWAKQTGKVQNLKMVLDILQEQGRFRISRALYEEVLKQVGEYA